MSSTTRSDRDPVLQIAPLGFPWQTIDPFLFCVHHVDDYPAGNERFGPDASLAGRQLGSDFASGGKDGGNDWRMYHGEVVPGFPGHPHRGFETVTFVRRGLIDHADSLGAAARFGRGDAQWLTAGAGIVHSEMFPLLDPDGPNPMELFQIWINLPPEDKFAQPHFAMLWSEEIPLVVEPDAAGRATEITVVAGAFRGHVPPPPPPDSWAARADTDVAIWHLRLDESAELVLPEAVRPDTIRTIYAYEGSSLDIDASRIPCPAAIVVACDRPVPITAGEGGASCLVLQGRPIGAPVVQHGPFVMNDAGEIADAFEDYRRTRFGGWPWPAEDPVHGSDPQRFARHADGTIRHPPS